MKNANRAWSDDPRADAAQGANRTSLSGAKTFPNGAQHGECRTGMIIAERGATDRSSRPQKDPAGICPNTYRLRR